MAKPIRWLYSAEPNQRTEQVRDFCRRVLAALRDPKCKNDGETIARALEGTWRPEHLFALRQAYELYRFHHQQISACDQIIQAELARLPNRAGDKPFTAKPRRCGRKPNDLSFDAAEPLFQALGVDLTRIEGIEVGTALIILAEIGVDVSRFPTEKHFASWLCAIRQLIALIGRCFIRHHTSP